MSLYNFTGRWGGAIVAEEECINITSVAALIECIPCKEGTILEECEKGCKTDDLLLELITSGKVEYWEKDGSAWSCTIIERVGWLT